MSAHAQTAALTALFLATVALCMALPFLVYNAGLSLPPGLYWCAPYWTTEDLPAGTIVYFLPPRRVTDALDVNPLYQSRLQEIHLPWMKYVSASEGDSVYVRGTHPDSLDSRAFGPIPRSSVQRTCTPLYTWSHANAAP